MGNCTLIRNRARALRREMSAPEVMLWSRLRGRGPDRPTFRRPHPVGSVILDFYCSAARLAVEVDGSTHWQRTERDEARDRWLARQGIDVLRIPAAEVYRDPEAVATGIISRASERAALIPWD